MSSREIVREIYKNNFKTGVYNNNTKITEDEFAKQFKKGVKKSELIEHYNYQIDKIKNKR